MYVEMCNNTIHYNTVAVKAPRKQFYDAKRIHRVFGFLCILSPTFHKVRHQSKVKVAGEAEANKVVHLFAVEFQKGFFSNGHKNLFGWLQVNKKNNNMRKR